MSTDPECRRREAGKGVPAPLQDLSDIAPLPFRGEAGRGVSAPSQDLSDIAPLPFRGEARRGVPAPLQDLSDIAPLPFRGEAGRGVPAPSPQPHILRPHTRREMLRVCSGGFGLMALAGLSSLWAGRAAADTGAGAATPHHPPRARRVIFLFMHGGPSAIDTFDPKPRLDREHGQDPPFKHPIGIIDPEGKLLRSPWEFRQYGESGAPVSSLFPEMAKWVDELCIVRSLHTEGQAHGQAVLKLHTGDATFVRPSLGSWVLYGLGSENENLPGFITIAPTPNHGGVQNYGTSFLPAEYQGTALGRAGSALREAAFHHLEGPPERRHLQRRQLDLIQELNRDHLARVERDTRLEGVIAAYELAFRMQRHAPKLLDLANESKATLDLYGIGEEPTDDFGRQCLLARRFAEAGVRFIQVSHSFKWDQHSKLKSGHEKNAAEVDKPIAGLLHDLKSRGLLEDTLVLWGGEFGRTPTAEKEDGRDHNPNGFTMWLAGGGVKPGLTYGATDEYGYHAVENRVHMHDLHATMLHLLGLDHTRLTYRHAGRDFRLTDVYGNIVHDLLARSHVCSAIASGATSGGPHGPWGADGGP
jgi:hypothetical protein